MKIKSLVNLTLLGILSMSFSLMQEMPTLAQQDTRFICAVSNNSPATIAQTHRGNIPIILWQSEFFTGSGYDPLKRCQIVSRKFQRFHEAGILRYLRGGSVNRQGVICAVGNSRSACNSESVLFTLHPGSDPSELIQQLNDIRMGARTTPLLQTGSGDGGTPSVNFVDFLNNAPVDPNATLPTYY